MVSLSVVGCSPESGRGVSGRIRSRPADNLTAPSYDFAVIQNEDRDGPLAAELLDLRAVARIRRPRPRPQPSALDPLDLVCVPGVIKRFRGSPARMGEWRWRATRKLFQRAGVENHEA